MHILTRIVLVGALLLAGCRGGEQAANRAEAGVESTLSPILTTPDAVDVHSYAKPLEARVTHVALDLTVDFDTRRIGGTAILDLDRKPDAKEIVLDDNGLEIE